MQRLRQKRRLWTPEEDKKLKEVKLKYPSLSWPDIAKKAKLNRRAKLCWERWNNHLKPGVNKENFSEEEDDTIISLQKDPLYRNKWTSIANHLPGRKGNAIKNRWNNHLKKMLAIIGDLERHVLTDDETSNHSVRGADLEALMAELDSLIPNVDPNAISWDDETSDHFVWGDDLEASTPDSADLIPNLDPNAIRSIMDTYNS